MTDPPFLVAAALVVPRQWARRVYWWTMDLYPEALAAHGVLHEKGFPYRALHSLTNAALGRLSGIVTLGTSQTRRLRSYRAWPREESGFVLEVPPWDRRPIPRVDRSDNRFLAAHGWQGRRIALYAGNLGEAHTFEPIMEAARLLAKDPLSPWVFVFVVRGARRPALEAASDGLPSLHVLDYVPLEWTADLLWAADVHLITMKPGWEGVVVPSKLYSVLHTEAPVLFIGPPEADTAREVAFYGAGECLPPSASGEDVVAALERLAKLRPGPRRPADHAGPAQVARFVTA